MKGKKVLILTLTGIIGSFCTHGVTAMETEHPKPAFEGAQWISVPSDSMALYADYLPVFKIGFDAAVSPALKDKSVKLGSFIFGADDPRLMNPDMNIYRLHNQPGESFIRMEIILSGHEETPDSVAFYRSGYRPDDNPNRALAVLPIGKLKPGLNSFELAVNLGHTDVWVNGEKRGYAGLNPIANGGDYTAFPVLGKIGFQLSSSDKSVGASDFIIDNLTVRHYRQPSNVIWRQSAPLTPGVLMSLPIRSMPEMRTSLRLNPDKQLAKATVNATAMGIYDLLLNGERIHDEYYLPGSTQYNKTHLYHTFDITDRLKQGENELRVQLGEGWWSGPSTFVGENWNFYGDRQAFLGEIIIDYTDGSSERFVTTPANWEVSLDGPIIVGSFFQGEIYDARREENADGLRVKAAAPERQWIKPEMLSLAEAVAPVAGGWENLNLLPSFGDRVLPVDTLTAVSVTEPCKGVYIYDMGQNMAGVPYLSFTGLQPGQEITIRHAEVLYPDMPQYEPNVGMIMTENLRAAMCRDIYIASGSEKEIFSPRHTLHGYRYLELTGLDAPLPLEAVKTIPVSSVHGFKAGFECSDSLVNRLWENIKWSTLSNFISLPTDCPQRNERLGWMGDISVYSPTATKIADVSALLRQYLQSVRDCQNENGKFPDVAPTGFGFGGFLWGSAGITVPWECYLQYGDTLLLKEHYPSMQRYVDYILREAMDPTTDLLVQNREWGDLGDWLSPEYDKTDKSLLWECYLIYDLRIMAEVARILGYDDEASRYGSLAEKRRKFFAETYVDPDTEKTRWSAFDSAKTGRVVDTQSSYALPLAMDIYDSPRFRDNFIAAIERENVADDGTLCPPYSLMTGFIGTAWIEEALSKIGRDDVAYTLLTSTSYPSWLYPVTQGATTVWERLNSYTDKDGFGSNNSMNSFNHYSFGSVGNWLITRCIGITVSPDGEVTVNPRPDPTGRITYARGWVDTPKGRVTSGWHREGDKIVYEVD